MMFVMLLWVYIGTGRARKICLPRWINLEMMFVMLLWGCIHTGQARIYELWNTSHSGRHIVQACPVWIYTQSNITNIIFTWVHNTNKNILEIFRECSFWIDSKHVACNWFLRIVSISTFIKNTTSCNISVGKIKSDFP